MASKRASDFTDLRDRVRATLVFFLITDLDVGLTRARIAAQAKRGSLKQRRNVVEAKKAFDAVRHFRSRTQLTRDEAAAIQEKLVKLEAAIDVSEDC